MFASVVMNTTDRTLVNTADAARYLGLAEVTLAAWRLKGVGPTFYRLGRAIRYDLGELEAWLSGQASDHATA